MIKNTFCHIPGIGLTTERHFWSQGLLSWDHLSDTTIPISNRRKDNIKRHIEESQLHFNKGNLHHFAGSLPSALHWRLFPDFRDSVAYLDIETTGLDAWNNSITTIALYDGKTVATYVQGENLDDFKSDIERFRVLVTYNGKCFDVPFVEWYLKIKLNQVHIDLRYVLRSLGYSGGLKGCEYQLGLDRGELQGLDGYFAVLLWEDYQKTSDRKALETLLAYNVEDVVNLEQLMTMAYNLKLRETPFQGSHRLGMPVRPEIPIRADVGVIQRVKRRFCI
jgi:uncharacterized protein YprB with RNaseH-like and TPR domain